MLKNMILEILHYPKLCNKINNFKYPWGWKSNKDIKEIINWEPINNNFECRNFDATELNNLAKKMIRDTTNSFKIESTDINKIFIKKYTEDIFIKLFHSYINNYDFLNSNIFSPKLAIGLNILRTDSEIIDSISSLKEINVTDVEILKSWIKSGTIKNSNKFLGYYNNDELIHEISAGIIGPEIRHIWDQQSIKQKVRVKVNSKIYSSKMQNVEDRIDVIDLERDLIVSRNETNELNSSWQVSNINRIII